MHLYIFVLVVYTLSPYYVFQIPHNNIKTRDFGGSSAIIRKVINFQTTSPLLGSCGEHLFERHRSQYLVGHFQNERFTGLLDQRRDDIQHLASVAFVKLIGRFS